MAKIDMPTDIVQEFIAMAETAAAEPNTFHSVAGSTGYDDLLTRWLNAADIAPPSDWLSLSSVKAVAAQLMRGSQGASLSIDQARTILVDIIADIRRGNGTHGNPHEQKRLIWVVFPNPSDESTRHFIEGSGEIGHPDAKWPLRMVRVDESILRLALVLDGPVDNRVGTPSITDYEGKWCLEYIFWGQSKDVWKPFEAWMEWATLWATRVPQWSAAFQYSLAVSSAGGTQMRRNDAVPDPAHVRAMQANNTVIKWDSHFSNLWTFLAWRQQRIQKIPQEDRHRLAVAMEIYHQLMVSRSASLFVVLSTMMAEALLGSDRELSRTVAQRIAWVLYPNESRETRWQSFQTEKLLYSLRSQIVHGRVPSHEVYQAYCRLAKKEKLPIMSDLQLTDALMDRNRTLLRATLAIERTQPLTTWADQHLME